MTYETREKAYEAQQSEAEALIGKVSQAPDRVHGSVLIVLPTKDKNLEYTHTVIKIGKEEDKIFFSSLFDLNLMTDARAIDRAGVFDSTSIVTADDGDQHDFGAYDYKIWAARAGQGTVQWSLVRRSSGQSIGIVLPTGKLSRIAFLNAFPLSVINAAADVGVAVTRQVLPAVPNGSTISGSGFFIDRSGHALTSAHVVQACKAIKVHLGDAGIADASLVSSDANNDLAVIKVASFAGGHATFTPIAAPRQGQDIVVYGFPLAGALTAQGNVVTGIVSALAGLKEDTRLMQITAPVQPGNSGGPVLDNAGHVLGLVTAKMNAVKVAQVTGDIPQNVNFAIKSSIIENFLDSNSVTYERAKSGPALPVADVASRAKEFTFMIQCER
ncbi:MAG: serine protease [Telmatospirillum sp.]|nr:serine protease [Telmatospirillum sp.]